MSGEALPKGGCRPELLAHRVDEACDRFEAEWRSGREPRIEEYLGPVAPLERPALLRELLALELELRRDRGERPEPPEYRQRFPADAELIVAAFTPEPLPGEHAGGGDVCADAGDAEFRPGMVLGSYELLELLGRGGQGVVFKACHQLMDRPVALKIIRNKSLAHPQVIARFLREMKTTSRLKHGNAVLVHDAGEHGDTLFLAMEFVEGIDLSKLVKQRGPLPVAEACTYVCQAAQGLQHAHELHLVHRDVKPSNLLLDHEQSVVKILDLGLSRLYQIGRETCVSDLLTSEGELLGTPDYIAPEQIVNSHRADIRADIYGLGCTLYYLLTGQPPFPGGSFMQKLMAHTHDAPRPVSTFRADLRDGLERVLDRMMSKDPADRYPTPAEIAQVLAPFAGSAVAVLSPPDGVAATLAAAPLAPPTWPIDLDAPLPVAPPRRHRPPVPMILVLLLAGALLLGLTVHLVRSGRGEPTIETKATGVAVNVPPRVDRVTVIPPTTGRKSGEVRRFEGHTGAVRSVAFSPDGQRALSGSGWPQGDRTMRLWEVASGRELRRFEGHTDQVINVVFSPDGRRALSGSSDRRLQLWDVESGLELRRFDGHAGGVNSVAFSPDGQRALSGGDDRTIRLWDVESGRELYGFAGHTDRVLSVAFSPDGRHALSGGADRTVRLWATASAHKCKVWVIWRDRSSPDILVRVVAIGLPQAAVG
jgi:eukaryotic-like serine/threonine-protein kinase